MKYAAQTKNLQSKMVAAHTPAYTQPTPPVGASVRDDGTLLKHIAQSLGGRKELAVIIDRHDSMLDLQIAGERLSPMEQCQRMIEKLYDAGQQEFALMICEGVLESLVGRAITREQFIALKQLARR